MNRINNARELLLSIKKQDDNKQDDQIMQNIHAQYINTLSDYQRNILKSYTDDTYCFIREYLENDSIKNFAIYPSHFEPIFHI